MLKKQIKYTIALVGTIFCVLSASTHLAFAQAFVPVQEHPGPLLSATENIRDTNIQIRDAVLTLPSIIGAAGNPDSLANLMGAGSPGGVALDPCATEPVTNFPAFPLQYTTAAGTSLEGLAAAPDTYTNHLQPNPDFQTAEQWIEAIILDEFGSSVSTPASDTRREELADEYFYMVATIYYLPNVSTMHSPANPANFYNTEVNSSGSLRCLLQELVEWRKLDLNLTIHQMVKEYFADAGVYVMSKRVQDIVAAATTEWAQRGMQQTLGPGITANTSAFVDNPDAQLQRVGGSVRGGVLDQIQDNPTGYEGYDLCEENVEYIYNDVAVNTLDAEIGSLELFPSQIACSDNSPAAISARETFTAGDYAGGGGHGQFIDYMYSSNNPIVASMMIRDNTRADLANANATELRQLDWGDGTLPTEVCANPADPYCRQTQVSTPASVNSQNIGEVQMLGWNNLSNADEFGETPSNEQQSLSLDVTTNPGGLLDYDTDSLRDPLLDPIEGLAKSNQEFRDSIEQYFDVNQDTRNWAANSLVFTWDNVQSYAGLEKYLANVLYLENI